PTPPEAADGRDTVGSATRCLVARDEFPQHRPTTIDGRIETVARNRDGSFSVLFSLLFSMHADVVVRELRVEDRHGDFGHVAAQAAGGGVDLAGRGESRMRPGRRWIAGFDLMDPGVNQAFPRP